MPVFTAEYLHKVSYSCFRAKGASEEEAEIVAAHQVKANLVGHDSHGVRHIPEYCNRIDMGHIVPGAPFVVENETPSTAVINGNWGFRVRGDRAGHADSHREGQGPRRCGVNHPATKPHRPPGRLPGHGHRGRHDRADYRRLRRGAPSRWHPSAGPIAAWGRIRSALASPATWKPRW